MKHGRLQPMGSKRVRHNGTTNRIFLYFYIKLVIHQVRNNSKKRKDKNQQRREKQFFRKCKMSEQFFSFFEIYF